MPANLITILGPTASGKTAVAAHLAHRIGGEVISGDSRQVYRGMDMGTGKDYQDYMVNGFSIPYHLIDIADAGEQLSVYDFQKHFFSVFSQIGERGKWPILCGGSGLYIEAAISGYKLIAVPENPTLRADLAIKNQEELEGILKSYKSLHNHTDTCNRKRLLRAIEIEEYYHRVGDNDPTYPTINSITFGVGFPREFQRQRITHRLRERLRGGMVDEVKMLMDSGIPPEKLIYYGLEYKWLTQYLQGQLPYDEMFSGLNTAIHQFAKRQMTWFRRMERNGITIHWVDHNLSLEQKVDWILQKINTHLADSAQGIKA